MSIDLSVYSERSEPVQRAALAQSLKSKGWHALFLDQRSMKEFSGGAVSSDLVYGTKKAPLLKTVKDLLAKRDEKRLEALFEDEEVGGCGVYATVPFNRPKNLATTLESKAIL